MASSVPPPDPAPPEPGAGLPVAGSARDTVLAGFLVASPAWAPWLSALNEVLTTITLLCGALLGVGRLWLFIRNRRAEAGDRKSDS